MIAHRQRGFTLLELLVVLCIITVMLAITAPQLAGRTQTAVLRSAGYDVQTMAAAARARAVLGGEVLELALVDQGTQLRLISRTDTGEETNILPPRQLPNTVRAQFNHQNQDGTTPERIRFQPDGSADGGMLRIVNEQGEELRLQLLTPLGKLQWLDSA